MNQIDFIQLPTALAGGLIVLTLFGFSQKVTAVWLKPIIRVNLNPQAKAMWQFKILRSLIYYEN
ncbi:MAG: hypothetical protein IPM42_07490 [Saprospiraceae bacterium]|nr:hypothetical protein [Saprospiraceae bacterium]